MLPNQRILYPAATVLGLAIALEVLSRVGLLSETIVPPVSDIITSGVRLLGEGGFWSDLWATVSGWLLGLLLSVVIGIPVGLLLGSQSLVHDAFRTLLEFIRPIPPIAILPLAVLVVGTGLEMKVLLVCFAAVWPILFQAMYGVLDVDPLARDVARGYGLTAWQQFRRVVLPSTLAYVATGFRLSIAVALSVTVAIEVIGTGPGIGAAINRAQYAHAPGRMYALIAITGVVGWLGNMLSRAVEKRVLRWHPSERAEAAS